jgi:hypothetical protein
MSDDLATTAKGDCTMTKIEPLKRDEVIIVKEDGRRKWKWVIRCAVTGYDAVLLRFRAKAAAETWLATDQRAWPRDAICP